MRVEKGSIKTALKKREGWERRGTERGKECIRVVISYILFSAEVW